ncbi:Cytochrome c551 peroxidase [hydrothermal vent metagenome]|uniref:Cytochrome c551 peroxidase n=1 Tax=hydrothermal vent metagenome TaxID=652676 RepID=A0A1W1BNE1_9ZZZZ
MKRLFHPVTITLFVVTLILLLPIILPNKKVKTYSDNELIQRAISTNMLPIPTTYKKLLKVVDNPQNRMTHQKIALGKELYNEKLLSRDKDIACASCHLLNQGGDDNMAVAIGYQGRANPFHLNSPTVLNSALAKSQFWNGRAKDVEEQAGGPIQAPFEMNMTPKEVVKRLRGVPAYVTKFQEVFNSPISFENIRKAIGAYERTLLTHGDYDKFLEGDNNALSAKAKRGMTLFMTKGCKGCHTGMSVGGQSIQQFPLRRYLSDYMGMIFEPNMRIKESPFPFVNEGGFLGRDNRLKFRVPILRNISKTAPYFHNGVVKELKEAVRIMSKYQIGDEFTPTQIDEVVAFLKSLDGELVEYEIK